MGNNYRDGVYLRTQCCTLSRQRPVIQMAPKMMKRVLLGCIWALCATTVPCVAQLPIDMNVEFATFRYDDAESIVEIYLGVGSASLEYEEIRTGFRATVPVTFGLWRATDAELEGTPAEAVWEQESELDFETADTTGIAEGQYHVRQLRITSPPGEYELRVKALAADGREVEIRRDVLVPAYSEDSGCSISDITLATSLTQTQDRSDPFYKNGLSIMPNTSALYGEGMPRLWYYAEAYNTDCVTSANDQYTALAFISGANAEMPFGGLQRRTQRAVRPVDVLVGTFMVNTLPTGSYLLRLLVLDEANVKQVERTQKFFVLNPSVIVEAPEAPEVGTFETSEYATMSEDEFNRALEHISVIETEAETERLGRIVDDVERRRFLMDFWRVRDPDPQTPANEAREEFYTLLEYANERYSQRSIEGWKTDRGRTLIKYGQPASIEPNLYDPNTKPYEVWTYNTIAGEGDATFIFADVNEFGEFELIHSTVAGERKLANWREELSSTRF